MRNRSIAVVAAVLLWVLGCGGASSPRSIEDAGSDAEESAEDAGQGVAGAPCTSDAMCRKDCGLACLEETCTNVTGGVCP